MDTTAGKRCSTCGLDRPADAFNVRRAAPDGLQARCRPCAAAWYADNAAQHRLNVRRANARRTAVDRERLVQHLLEHPCVDCGEQDLRVLDMDHRDPTRKRADVARLLGMSSSWDRLLAEIAECDVRCANCHRRRTAEVNGWWRHRRQVDQQGLRSTAAGERLARVLPSA